MKDETTNAGATVTETAPAADKDESVARAAPRPATTAPTDWRDDQDQRRRAGRPLERSARPSTTRRTMPPATGVKSAPRAGPRPSRPLTRLRTTSRRPPPRSTLDDVREVALKLRDKTSMDEAKAFIATFGVAKVADLPRDKFGDFITKANEKLTRSRAVSLQPRASPAGGGVRYPVAARRHVKTPAVEMRESLRG